MLSRASMLEAISPDPLELATAAVSYREVEVQDKKQIIDSLKRALHESQDAQPHASLNWSQLVSTDALRSVKRKGCRQRRVTKNSEHIASSSIG